MMDFLQQREWGLMILDGQLHVYALVHVLYTVKNYVEATCLYTCFLQRFKLVLLTSSEEHCLVTNIITVHLALHARVYKSAK